MRLLRWTLLLLCCWTVYAQQPFHLLDIIPNQAGTLPGKVCLFETTGWTTGAVQGVCLKAPASIATDFDWTFPNANPGATNCLEVTTSGQIQYAAGACGTGGGTFYQTMEDNGVAETQRPVLNFVSAALVLTDDAGGNETDFTITSSPTNSATFVGTGRLISTTSPILGGGNLALNRTISLGTVDISANTNLSALLPVTLSGDQIQCPTCLTTNTVQDITANKSFNGGNLIIEDPDEFQFANSTGALTSHKFTYGGANTTDILDSSSGIVLQIRSNVTPDEFLVNATIFPGVNNTFDLGFSSFRFKKAWLVNLDVSSTSLFAAAATFNGGIVLAGTSDVDVGATGELNLPRFTGGDMGCSGAVDGKLGFREDTNELQYCDNGTLVKFSGT